MVKVVEHLHSKHRPEINYQYYQKRQHFYWYMLWPQKVEYMQYFVTNTLLYSTLKIKVIESHGQICN
jgi:hypothetical protein